MIKYADEIKTMNLWEKIANISAEIGNLQKDDKIGKGDNAYKAISIEKVVKAVGEKMNKYGVVIYPIQQQYKRTDERVMGYDYNKNQIEKINRISDVDVTYQVVNIHNPVEIMYTVASGTGVDTQDKGVGKAQTYAYKNMLLKLFAIPTGDDTDKIHSDDYTNKLYGTKAGEVKEDAKEENVNKDSKVNVEQVDRLYKVAYKSKILRNQVDELVLQRKNKAIADLTIAEYEPILSYYSGLANKK